MFGLDKTQDYFEFYSFTEAIQVFVCIRDFQLYPNQMMSLHGHWLV